MKAIERRAEEKNRITNRDGEREREREREASSINKVKGKM